MDIDFQESYNNPESSVYKDTIDAVSLDVSLCFHTVMSHSTHTVDAMSLPYLVLFPQTDSESIEGAHLGSNHGKFNRVQVSQNFLLIVLTIVILIFKLSICTIE